MLFLFLLYCLFDHNALRVSQQPNNPASAHCPHASDCVTQSLCVDYYCSHNPVFCCAWVSCCKTAKASVAAVCLQPLSVDLWLQVLIMAANFKGLVGSVPTTACCRPSGPLCVCVCKKRDKVSSWVISRLSCVCTCVCVFVCFSLKWV